MPGATYFTVKPLHPTFACEVEGLDLSKPISDDAFAALQDTLHKYGVVVIRGANFPSDKEHIEFSARFGEVEKSKYRNPHMRSLPYPEIFDISNLDEKNEVVTHSNEKRTTAIRGNMLWHADGSFNPRRTYVSCLNAVELPPPNTGGHTEYADARTAYEDLPEETKEKIKDLVAVHSFLHNRKTANPDSPLFKDLNVLNEPLARHKLVPIHEPTGRPVLYAASYTHHIEGMPIEEGQKLIKELMEHTTQPKYVFKHHWANNGDVAIWDNTAVLHRATTGTYEGKYRRDMRRTCVMDSDRASVPIEWEPYDYDAEDEDDYDDDEERGSDYDDEDGDDVTHGNMELEKNEGGAGAVSWDQMTGPMIYFGMPFRGINGFDQAFCGLWD